ncbi:MAG: M48 family metallopeptidase [Oscillospiraceae bacterium]|nr:M48 family metallopeptidase [Oscillospiraceae bacterium]
MSVSSNLYIHELDRSALAALKAIPGFTAVLKGFMKIWSEKQFRIQNMATKLRINEKQLSKYYDMLPPICEKLGIEVPELYLELSGSPNSYTSGDTKPFIVVTSGLLEKVPEHLIPTVLAHECGHIACHHVLYHTMGNMIINGAAGMFELGDLITYPIQIAFYKWMRCSEYSADRAAAICDGTVENMKELCACFAGYNRKIGSINMEAFMEQAVEYKEMTEGSNWNKVLEFAMVSEDTHPLNAVRAYEINSWGMSEQFINTTNYIACTDGNYSFVPLADSDKFFVGKEYKAIEEELHQIGFRNVKLAREVEGKDKYKKDAVIRISIDGVIGFERASWHNADSEVVITYFDPLTKEEIAAQHPDEICVPHGAKWYVGGEYQKVYDIFKELGFTDITVEKLPDLKRIKLLEDLRDAGRSLINNKPDATKGASTKENTVATLSIGGNSQFEMESWFKPDAPVRITYHVYSDNI